jgi:hypothetical protein
MDTKYIAREIVGGLGNICYPEGRNPHERRIALHLDNAPMHNTRMVMGQWEQPGFQRMGHPAYNPDLVPADFFLFHYVKEQLKERSFAEEEKRILVLSELMSEIPPDMILRVFTHWNRRLRQRPRMEGEYPD